MPTDTDASIRLSVCLMSDGRAAPCGVGMKAPQISPPKNTGGSDIGWPLAIHRAIGRVPRLRVPLDIEAGRQTSWLLAVHHGCRRRLAAEYIQTFLTPLPVSASGPHGGPPHTPTHPPPQPWFPQQTPPWSTRLLSVFCFSFSQRSNLGLDLRANKPTNKSSLPSQPCEIQRRRPLPPNNLAQFRPQSNPPPRSSDHTRTECSVLLCAACNTPCRARRVGRRLAAAAPRTTHHAPRTQSSRPALGLSALHTPRPPCRPL